MAFGTGSRLLQTAVIQPTDFLTGQPSEPAFVDIRPQVRVFAEDDRALHYDNFGSWANLGMKYLLGAEYWWAMADLSEIVDPFNELVQDATLRSPTVERFQFDILPGDII